MINPTEPHKPEKYELLVSVVKRFAEQMQAIDELTVVILKGHLLIEEILERIITKFVHHGNYVLNAGLRFRQLVAIARSIDADTHDNGIWDVILAANKLRNQLAHSLNPEQRRQKVDQFKAVYAGFYTEAPDRPDPEIAKCAFAMCLGFLASLEAHVERSRAATPVASVQP